MIFIEELSSSEKTNIESLRKDKKYENLRKDKKYKELLSYINNYINKNNDSNLRKPFLRYYILAELAKENYSDAQNSLGDLYKNKEIVYHNDIVKKVEKNNNASSENKICYSEEDNNISILYKNKKIANIPKEKVKNVDIKKAVFSFLRERHKEIINELILEKAFNYYKKAAEQENAEAINNLGDCYRYGIGTAENPEKAFKQYYTASEKNSITGHNNLGDCYRYGIGAAKNDKKAFESYEKATKFENAEGLNNLGDCYRYGIGTIRDDKKAFEKYRKAANKGNTLAQNNLGNCYSKGEGTKKDTLNAFKYYEKAAKNGLVDADVNLAICYKTAKGTYYDPKKAVEIFKKAAQKNHVTAFHELAKCYAEGSGIKKDLNKSNFLLKYTQMIDQSNAYNDTDISNTGEFPELNPVIQILNSSIAILENVAPLAWLVKHLENIIKVINKVKETIPKSTYNITGDMIESNQYLKEILTTNSCEYNIKKSETDQQEYKPGVIYLSIEDTTTDRCKILYSFSKNNKIHKGKITDITIDEGSGSISATLMK